MKLFVFLWCVFNKCLSVGMVFDMVDCIDSKCLVMVGLVGI